MTVTADHDADAIDEADVTLTHVTESADSEYNGISVDSVTVAVDDDDTASVTVTVAGSATELSVTEGGSNTYGLYELSLSSQPIADVTVTIAGHDGSDLTLSGLTLNSDYELTFTDADWSTAQTVTVTAAEDDDAGTDDPVDLTHTAASGDPDYDGISVDSVKVTIIENDDAAITVKDTAATTEMDTELDMPEIGTGTYTVTLSHPPTSDVTIDITVSCDTGSCEVTTNPTRLTINALNWDTAQTVTVIAGNDDDAIHDGATITHTVDEGSADECALVVVADVTVNVIDNDTAGLSVSPAAIGIVEEGTGTFTAVLTSEPSDDVTVEVASADAAIGTVTAGASLTFSPTNWDRAQPVTVSGTDDADNDNGDETTTVTATASSTDTGFQGETADVTVTVTDNDAAGVVLTPPSLTVTEGETGTYTLSLAHEPSANVTIDATAEAGAGITVNDGDTASVTFTPSNWNRPRSVTVAAAEDDDKDHSTARITHAFAADSAAEYAVITIGDVVVTIEDDDVPGLRIDTEGHVVTKGRTATFTVSLNSAPDAGAVQTSVPPQFEAPEVRTDLGIRPPTDVDVTIHAAGDLSVEPTVLRFTASNWNVPQQVEVTANGAAADSRFTIVHAIAGPTDYANVGNEGLDLTVRPPVRSNPGGGGSSGGGGGGGGGGLDVGVATFVVANGWSAADVGVAAVLAARTSGAVVVYTAGDVLSAETSMLLREASPVEVVIVGGIAAVSRDVRTQIRAASSESGVTRITGDDRSDTAAATARRILGGPSDAGRVTLRECPTLPCQAASASGCCRVYSSRHIRRMTRLARCRLWARRASRRVLPSVAFRARYSAASGWVRCWVTDAM